MSKSDTIATLLESAIIHFSRYGYDGASLRRISADAGVPLATTSLYFGSKQGLYAAVKQYVWAEIDAHRRTLLQCAIADHAGHPPFPAIVEALIRPIVSRAMSAEGRQAARVGLLRTASGPPRPRSADLLPDAAKLTAEWLDAIAVTCPGLTRTEAIWAFSYILGTAYSSQVLDGVYDALAPGSPPRDPEDVIAEIVAFGCGGVAAMRKRSSRAN